MDRLAHPFMQTITCLPYKIKRFYPAILVLSLVYYFIQLRNFLCNRFYLLNELQADAISALLISILEFCNWFFLMAKWRIFFFANSSFLIPFSEETTTYVHFFFKSDLYPWKFCLIKVIPRNSFLQQNCVGKLTLAAFLSFFEQLKGFAMIILLTVCFVTSSKTQQSGRDQRTRLHGSASYCSCSQCSPGAKTKHIAFLQAFCILHW